MSTKPEVQADFWEFYNVRDIMTEMTPAQFMTLFEQSRPGWRVYGKAASMTEMLMALLCDLTIAVAPKKKGAKKAPSVVNAITKGTTDRKSTRRTLTLDELKDL